MENKTADKLYRDINDIMTRFDFAQVAKVMEFMNWTWAGSSNTPTVEEIQSTALMLLDGCVTNFVKEGYPSCGAYYATGGLAATVTTFGDVPELKLVFKVEEQHSYSWN